MKVALSCLRYSFLLLIPFCGAALQACWAPVPASYFVDEAEVILHLKVVAIEEPDAPISGEGDDAKWGSEYAVCDIKHALLGLFATDRFGRVRLACPSRKNSVQDSTAVRYNVGDELTLISRHGEFDPKLGTVYPGGGHPNRRPAGAPGRELRKLLQNRLNDAEAKLAALERLLPGARAIADAALDEIEDGTRDDLSDLTAGADLVLELAAVARMTPGLTAGNRPTHDAATRDHLARVALQALAGLSRPGADAALELIERKGNGAAALLAPAEVQPAKAREVLNTLHGQEQLDGFLAYVLRHDSTGRAAAWAGDLALNSESAAVTAQWSLIEAGELGRLDDAAVKRALRFSEGTALVKASAWHLCAWLHPELLVANKAGTARLEVYTYLLCVRGAEDKRVIAERKWVEQETSSKGATFKAGDVVELQGAIRMGGGEISPALRRAIRAR